MKPLIKKGGVMQCPVCNGGMWDNTKKKLNPKAPDYRCKDEECKYSLNPDTGEYETGNFTTGIWLKKEVEKSETQMQHSIKPTPKEHGFQPDMRLSYRKDLMVALINTYQTTISNEDLKNLFNDYWAEIEK